MKLLSALAVLTVMTSCVGTKKGAAPSMPMYEGSAEFQRMKTLVGVWRGDGPMGPMKFTYTVTAAGSMLQERVFEGTPMEMLSAYYDEGGKLCMTHFCALHNRPKMRLIQSTADSLSFDFVPSPGINPAKDHHMHSAKITFLDTDRIRFEGSAWSKGKVEPCGPPLLLTRE